MERGKQVSYPIARYLNARSAYGPTFSADGGYVAFLTDITGVPQVWRVAVATGQSEPLWPDQLTFGNDRVLEVHYSPALGDGRLIFARDAGGNENAQIYLLPGDGSEELPLTAGHEDAMHAFGAWSKDGRRLLFAANRRDPGIFDLYLKWLDGDEHLLWRNGTAGYLTNVRFSPDGQRAVVTRMQSSFDHELLEVDLASGDVRQLLAAEKDVRYVACEYAADGRALYLNTDLGADHLHIARLGLEDDAFDTLAAPDWDCEAMRLAPGGARLAYAVNVEGTRQLYALDLRTGTTRQCTPLVGVPGILADGRLVFSPDGERLAFSLTTATRTADIHIWGVEADALWPATRSSHGGIPRQTFVAPELVHYPTFDRTPKGKVRQIPAWLYLPTVTEAPYPVVVLVHGGPESQYSPGFHPVIQYLLASGYAVLAPNVRGSTGYGKAYSHLDDVEKRMDSVADLAHAAYWLRERTEIDPKRIVVYGGSYGGFMVLSALTTYPDLWRAAVDIVGISSLVTFLENTSDYRRAHREAEYGSLARDRAFLEAIAPINHVDRIKAPLMVIHGANDPRVPLSEAEQLVAALEARGVPVEFLVFRDEGHGLVKLDNKLVAYPAIVAFLERFVAR
jgi:dipeptidyl aminopeptidase/acylaminoacyl peptidase